MEKSALRPVVFDLIKRQKISLGDFKQQLKQLYTDFDEHDALKVQEILWELLVEGVLAPGFDEGHLNLPQIHLTEYGQKCLDAEHILPHDPDGYIKRFEKRIDQEIDSIVLTYVRESLYTFLGGHYLASTVMLGVASERCIDLLIDAYATALSSQKKRAIFIEKIKSSGRSIKRRFDLLRDRLLPLQLPSPIHDALDIQLSGIFTLIRMSRNSVGHPTGRIVDRNAVYGNLLVFPQYATRVYDLIDFFKHNHID